MKFKSNLLLIAPNENVANVANQVIKDNDLNCRVVIGNLDQGVKLAQVAEKTGVEVIISRGGTYLAIKEVVKNIPLIQIHVSAVDLLEALHQASILNDTKKNKIRVVGYSNIIEEVSMIAKYLKMDITEIHVEDENNLEESLLKEFKKDTKIVVGDTISVEIAQKIGLKGVLISSRKRAIFEALESAEGLAMLRRKESIEQNRIKAIIDEFPEGIVVLDAFNYITHSNSTANNYLGLSSDKIIGKNICEVIPKYQRDEELVTLSGQQFMQHSQKITYSGDNEVGYIITFKLLKQLQEAEVRLRKKLHKNGLIAKYRFNDIIGKSEQIVKIIEKAKKFSKSDATLLITGETGVGKEMFAQSIHNASNRSEGPFIAVNCAAFAESLLESELFGYVEGSFTDARKGGKTGLFELAHGGTVFLDEIGDMSLSVQAKVLRVLQEKEIIRIGDNKVIPVDIRIIAATNYDLWQAVTDKKFREDLFYRINVLKLNIPSLRERGDDVFILSQYFLNKKGININVDSNIFDVLISYDWPGNVRELSNFIEQLALLNDGDMIKGKDVFELLKDAACPILSDKDTGEMFNREITDESILLALKKYNGNKSLAAKFLQIDRSTIWRRLKKMKKNKL